MKLSDMKVGDKLSGAFKASAEASKRALPEIKNINGTSVVKTGVTAFSLYLLYKIGKSFLNFWNKPKTELDASKKQESVDQQTTESDNQSWYLTDAIATRFKELKTRFWGDSQAETQENGTGSASLAQNGNARSSSASPERRSGSASPERRSGSASPERRSGSASLERSSLERRSRSLSPAR